MIDRMSCDGRNAVSHARMRRASTRRWLACLVLLMFFGAGPAAQVASAQPFLTFSRVINNWPTIELYFTIACNGQPVYVTDSSKVRVFENGREVDDFTLWCPDPQSRCDISVALVFDASGSMIGPGQAGAIAAGNAFINNMDGVIDEAAVLAFSSGVSLLQGMTTDTSALRSAVNSINAGGATAVWDGIYAGLEEVIAHGKNHCRAVIALTDGGDNSSSHTPTELISLATRNRIRVYTVGLGTGIDAALLQAIATQTGGRYYQTPSGSELALIYQEIFVQITQSFRECMITYQAGCKDGGLRTVDLQLLDVCGGTDTKSKTYRALKDTTTYAPLTIQAGSVVTLGNTTVKVPITLVDTLRNELFHPASFTLLFDRAKAQLQTVSTAGTLLDGVALSVAHLSNGVTITTTDRAILYGTGTLFELTFATADLPGVDTLLSPLHLENWTFEAGCFRPTLLDGMLSIVPARAHLTCSLVLPTITANDSAQVYEPMPFEVSVQVRNDGALASDTVRVQLTLQGALRFAVPDHAGLAVKLATPPVLPPGASAFVTWRVEHPVVQTKQTYTLDVVMLHDGRSEGGCTAPLVIPALLPPAAVSITPNGATTFCEGGSVILDAGAGHSSYQWSSGERTRSIVVRRSGSYTVRVVDGFGRDVTSPPVTVTVLPALAPRLVLSGGDGGLCPGDTIEIDAGAGYADYLWSTGATTRTMRVWEAGQWWVTVRSAEGCSGTSDTVTTVLLPEPPVPVITQTDQVLTTVLAGYQYQWYRNGVAIPGATNQFLFLTENGTYTLEIRNQSSCASMSAPLVVTTVSVEVSGAAGAFRLECHPNPVRAEVEVRIDGAGAGPVSLTLVDAGGRVQRVVRDLAGGGRVTHRLSVGDLPPGVYFLIAATRDAVQLRKFVKVE